MRRYAKRLQKAENRGWLVDVLFFLLSFSFFIPFVVADGTLFPKLIYPYVTGKVLSFRILIELCVALYVLLVFMEPKYFPRFTPLLATACAFVLWGGICVLTSGDPAKSFWGNTERIDGYVTLVHLFFYFVIVSLLIRTGSRWRNFLQISVFFSTIISIYSLIQFSSGNVSYRLDVVFGSPTYLAGYLLFGIFIAMFLAVNEPGRQLQRAVYSCLISVQVLALWYTQTRGAILGVLIGGLIVLFSMIWAALSRSARSARSLYVAILFFIVCAGAVTFFVVINQVIPPRFHRLFSMDDGSIKARLYSWEIAWRGFLQRPIFGWGQENFNLVVGVLDPDHAGDELLDRAHNQFIDWLVAGGMPMFVLYMLLWLFALKGLLQSNLSVRARLVLCGLWAAYFINNMFVFDNVVSAMYFWLLLAFSNVMGMRRKEGDGHRAGYGKMVMIAPSVFAAFLGLAWSLNARTYFKAQELSDALAIRSPNAIISCARDAITTPC
jgi:O-antigen ligase